MKSYDETISAVFDRIRENKIEKQRKRKMAAKLITSLGCLCLVVAVCVGVWNIDFSSLPGDEKTPVEENKNEENKPKEDIFLYVPGQSSPSKVTGFVSAGDYGVDTGTSGSEDKVFDKLKGEEKKPFKSLGTFVYQDSNCRYKNTNTEKEYGDFYSIYDIYVEKDVVHPARVTYLHGTDILTSYIIGDAQRPSPNDTMEEALCKKIAQDFILNIITLEEFSKFSDDGVFTNDGNGLYTYIYTRYIEGYATDETISISMNCEGEVYIYSSSFLGKYDTLEAELTKEKLDTANEKLRNKVEELRLTNLSMGISRIVTSTSGEAFLRISIGYDTVEGGRTGDYVYINIQ